MLKTFFSSTIIAVEPHVDDAVLFPPVLSLTVELVVAVGPVVDVDAVVVDVDPVVDVDSVAVDVDLVVDVEPVDDVDPVVVDFDPVVVDADPVIEAEKVEVDDSW